MTRRGKYIVVEGDEGSGKGEQTARLASWLEAQGIAVAVVREPGGDPVAEELRKILKHSSHPIVPLAELFGFLMARAQVLELKVQPLLDAGTWVLSDRSTLSTFVYQGEMRGLLDSQTKSGFVAACQLAQTAAEPDLTLVLDVSLAQSKQRIAGRGKATDRFESVGDAARTAINDGYRRWARTRRLTKLVDGTGTREEVEAKIRAHIEPLIAKEQ